MANKYIPLINDIGGNVGISATTAQVAKLQVGGNIYPDLSVTYSLGAPSKTWLYAYIANMYGTASWASSSISASYALSASWTPSTPSSATVSASWASQSLSSSWSPSTFGNYAISASWASSSLSSSWTLPSSSIGVWITNQTSTASNVGGQSTLITGNPSAKGLVIQGSSINIDTTVYTDFIPITDVTSISSSWYSADKEVSYSNGNQTTTWTDFGSGSRTLTKAGAGAGPIYRTNALNGKSVFEFSASMNMSASISHTDTFFKQNYQSAFILFQETSLSTNWWEKSLMACDIGGGNNNKWIWGVDNNGSVVWECHNFTTNLDNQFNSSNGVVSAGTWTLLEFTKSGSIINVYKNGTNVISNQNATNYPPSIAAPFNVGFGEGTTSNTFTGQIAEILFYSGSLSANDRQKVEGYLLWKYGLSSSLPVSHPYTASAPSSSYIVNQFTSQTSNFLEFSSSIVSGSIVGLSYVSASGQFVGTSSYALSASWSPSTLTVSASWASQSLSASWAPGGASSSLSSSYALTASYAANSSGGTQISCSWASSSISASYALTASFALNGGGTSILGNTASFISAQAYHTVLQTIQNAAWTSISFSSTVWDDANFHGNTTYDSRMTVPYTGKYLVSANIGVTANATGQRGLSFAINGSGHYGYSDITSNTGVAVPGLITTTLLDLTSGSYVESQIYQDSGGPLTLLADTGGNAGVCRFSIAYLGILGTASYALQSLTASYALNGGTGGGSSVSSSWASSSISSSYALTASYAANSSGGGGTDVLQVQVFS